MSVNRRSSNWGRRALRVVVKIGRMGRIGTGAALAFLCVSAAIVGADGLDGTIKGGKAKKFVQKADGLYRKGDEIFKRWWKDEVPDSEIDATLKRGVKILDEAAQLYAAALDIKFDSGVNSRLRIVATRIQRMQFSLMWREQKRRREANEKKKKEGPHPPTENPDQPPAEEEPESDPGRREPEQLEAEPQAVRFEEGRPPAVPVNATLAHYEFSVAGKELEKLLKRDRNAIYQTLKTRLQARRGKLTTTHVLCAGTGKIGAETCADCCGSGVQVNLYLFRKLYWNCFTPLLRDTNGALDALKAFHGRAQKDASILEPTLKAFSIPKDKIENHNFWARALVKETTKAGTEERFVTLVSIGSSWYLFTPATDGPLLPGGNNK